MAGPEQTFTPRVVDVDHGETVFAVDYRQTFFRRNLRRPVLSTGSSFLLGRGPFDRLPAFDLGQSLVAEAVNHLLEHGAEPVFAGFSFWGLAELKAQELVHGAVQGCREAGCALAPPQAVRSEGAQVGACASAVGVTEHKRVIDARRVLAGDRVLGLLSAGFLPCDLMGDPRAWEALEGSPPARPLARPVLQVLRRYRQKQPFHAGIVTGLRVWRQEGSCGVHSVLSALEAKLPSGLKFQVAAGSAILPDEAGPLWRGKELQPALAESRCGLGLVVVVAPHFARSIEGQLRRRGVKTIRLGQVLEERKPE